MTWFEAIPTLTVSALVIILIGAPFAWAIGARGITFLALSIASSVSSVVVSSFVAPYVGIPWQITTPFLVSLPLAVIGFVLRRRLTKKVPPGQPREWGALFAVAIGSIVLGGILIAATVIPAIGHVDDPSQTYDAIFHLNAVRWVLDTGDASPIHMTMTTPGATTSFYPTPWHAIVALVVQLTGAKIVVATNAVAFVTATVIWPTSCVFLARVLFGPQRLVLVLAGAASAAFAAFPILLLSYGVLYPNMLADSLLPIVLGILVLALGRGSPTRLSSLALWLLAAWVICGDTVAHPNALFSLFALSAPLVIYAGIAFLQHRRRRPHRIRRMTLTVVAILATFAVESILWTRIGTTDDAWKPATRFYTSVAEAIANGPLDVTVAVAISVFVFVGLIVALFRRRYLWIVISYAISVFMFAIANAWPSGALRTAITGLWYNDAYRLAALLPIAGVPLAVLGLLTIIRWLQRHIRRRDATPALSRMRTVGSALAAVCVVLVVVATQGSSIRSVGRHLVDAYRFDSSSPLLSPQEQAVFADVTRLVPRGNLIADNPWNGSSLVYAYTGRPALFPHVGGRYPQEYRNLAAGLAAGTPKACAAARDLGVKYVLDFGDNYVFKNDPRAKLYSGITDLSNSSVVSLLAGHSQAKLYKITGCGFG